MINKFKAYERIKPHVKRTTLLFAGKISKLVGANVYLKLENLQYNGSFKIRGATNKVLKLLEDKTINKNTHIYAASAGNHAQGVALACQRSGLKCTIVMPVNTPLQKIDATRELEADIILKGNNVNESLDHAIKLCKKNKGEFIHPYDDQDIIDGQASIGFEIYEELPEIDAFFCPIGGGGLISGIAQVLKSLKPEVKIIGVESKATNSFQQSIEKNKVIEIVPKASIADGIAVKKPGVIPFNISKKLVDEFVSVSEEEIASTIIYLLEKCKLIAEGAGATAVTSILSPDFKYKNKNVVAIISGGNIDLNIIEQIIKIGLSSQGRRMEINILIENHPGELAKITNIISQYGGNILNVYQDRNSGKLKMGEILFTGLIETSDQICQNKILKKLKNEGYVVEVI